MPPVVALEYLAKALVVLVVLLTVTPEKAVLVAPMVIQRCLAQAVFTVAVALARMAAVAQCVLFGPVLRDNSHRQIPEMYRCR
jgi:hypothetical protein